MRAAAVLALQAFAGLIDFAAGAGFRKRTL
jgi:hypothetical protein